MKEEQAPGEQGKRKEQAIRRTGKEERTSNQENRKGRNNKQPGEQEKREKHAHRRTGK